MKHQILLFFAKIYSCGFFLNTKYFLTANKYIYTNNLNVIIWLAFSPIMCATDKKRVETRFFQKHLVKPQKYVKILRWEKLFFPLVRRPMTRNFTLSDIGMRCILHGSWKKKQKHSYTTAYLKPDLKVKCVLLNMLHGIVFALIFHNQSLIRKNAHKT